MFGLFKSKEDKKAEQIVEELRENLTKYYEGNVVEELGSIIQNRYKLTASIFESISSKGLLPGLEGSGSVAIAISKNEILFITFEPNQQETKVQLAKYPEEMLNNIEKNLITDSKIAKHNEGAIYDNTSGIWAFIGALTLLGHEVGPAQEEGNYFPFKYKKHNFVVAEYEGRIYIVYQEV